MYPEVSSTVFIMSVVGALSFLAALTVASEKWVKFLLYLSIVQFIWAVSKVINNNPSRPSKGPENSFKVPMAIKCPSGTDPESDISADDDGYGRPKCESHGNISLITFLHFLIYFVGGMIAPDIPLAYIVFISLIIEALEHHIQLTPKWFIDPVFNVAGYLAGKGLVKARIM